MVCFGNDDYPTAGELILQGVEMKKNRDQKATLWAAWKRHLCLWNLDLFPEGCIFQPFFFYHVNDRCTYVSYARIQFLVPNFFCIHFHSI